MTKQRFDSIKPWLIWGLAAFFFFAHYVVRVTTGLISEELQLFFETSKFKIGVLGSAFYLPYVIMQMPVGYLVDRFGSRLLLTIAVLICSLSSLIFANATDLNMAILSRVLLGFCSAAAFISALKLATVWFEPKKLALLVGVTQALGMMGAAAGTGVVVPYLTNSLGWQNTYSVYACCFLVLALLMFCIIRDKPEGYISSTLSQNRTPITAALLIKVLKNKYTWINACFAGLIYAPTDAMAELWGSEFLRHIHGIDPLDASRGISLLFLGWAIGGPIAGWLADRLGRRPVMILSAIAGAILLPLVFYVPGIPVYLLWFILFLYGLTNTGLIASYAAAGELQERELAGFSMAIANMFSVLVGAMLMPLLGFILETLANSHIVDGALVFTASDYQRATLILPLCLVLAVIFAFFTKETLPPSMRQR